MSSLKRTLKAFLGIALIRPYFALRTSYPVWFWVMNYESRHMYREMPASSAVAQRVAGDLARDGIAVTSLDELLPGSGYAEKLRAYFDAHRSSARVREEKPFLLQIWDDRSVLDLENPFVELIREPAVLGTIAAYFKAAPKFHYFSLDITTPVSLGAAPQRSQNWHRDPEDRKMCKIFLYLSDVDESAGPFTYIRGSHREGRYGHLFPQRPPKGSYPPANELESVVAKEDIHVGTGRAGTLIFCDTSGIHRGGYATGKERTCLLASLPPRPRFGHSTTRLRLVFLKDFTVCRDGSNIHFHSPWDGFQSGIEFQTSRGVTEYTRQIGLCCFCRKGVALGNFFGRR